VSTLAQGLVVAVIVGVCALYAVWTLLPPAARRSLATAALRFPLPAVCVAPLNRAAQASKGCACDGCDHASPGASTGMTHPVVFHPRRRP
jgi:ferrous iron transport protein B